MPRSQKTKSFSFKQTIKVEVKPAEFHLFPSLKYLDAAALSRADKVTIEVGFYKTKCCELYVRAVIESGKVVRLETDECKNGKPAGKELAALFKTAIKRLGRRPSTQWKPMPVRELLQQADKLVLGNCIHLCIPVINYCTTCCINHGRIGCIEDIDLILDGPKRPAPR